MKLECTLRRRKWARAEGWRWWWWKGGYTLLSLECFNPDFLWTNEDRVSLPLITAICELWSSGATGSALFPALSQVMVSASGDAQIAICFYILFLLHNLKNSLLIQQLCNFPYRKKGGERARKRRPIGVCWSPTSSRVSENSRLLTFRAAISMCCCVTHRAVYIPGCPALTFKPLFLSSVLQNVRRK